MLVRSFPVTCMGYNCVLKGVLLSEEPQFAEDSRKASWDRIRAQKAWGLYHPAGAL